MTNEDSENKNDNADICPECGSNETESGATHEYCSDCGKQLCLLYTSDAADE